MSLPRCSLLAAAQPRHRGGAARPRGRAQHRAAVGLGKGGSPCVPIPQATRSCSIPTPGLLGCLGVLTPTPRLGSNPLSTTS